MRVRLISRVFSDIASAMDYYLIHAGARIAGEFWNEFERCQQIIGSRPESYPIIRDDIRRINFRRFPYHILYQIVNEEHVKVLTVKHDSRDPDLGLDR